MRFCTCLLLSLVILAGNAGARIGERIDPRKRADINGQTVELPRADLPTLSLPVLRHGTAPASRERATPGGKVETHGVEVTTLEFDRVETPGVPQPRANFGPKRPVDTRVRVTTGTVPAPAADISPYRIEATTPAGQQELRRQLNRRP